MSHKLWVILNGYVVMVFIGVSSTGHSDLVIYPGLNDQRVCEGFMSQKGVMTTSGY